LQHKTISLISLSTPAPYCIFAFRQPFQTYLPFSFSHMRFLKEMIVFTTVVECSSDRSHSICRSQLLLSHSVLIRLLLQRNSLQENGSNDCQHLVLFESDRRAKTRIAVATSPSHDQQQQQRLLLPHLTSSRTAHPLTSINSHHHPFYCTQ
jgi:hypothetical protein